MSNFSINYNIDEIGKSEFQKMDMSVINHEIAKQLMFMNSSEVNECSQDILNTVMPSTKPYYFEKENVKFDCKYNSINLYINVYKRRT